MTGAAIVAPGRPGSVPVTDLGPAIRLVDVSKRYGSVLAVDHISFVEPAGTIAALLGPNGAGKTTTAARTPGRWRDMAWSVLSSRRIAGIIRRHLYLLRRSWPRLFLLGALVFLLSSRSARGQDVLLQVGE